MPAAGQQEARKASEGFASLADEARGGLAQSVEDFAGNVTRALSLHLGEYQKQLGDAISLLRTALEELAEVTADGVR